MSQFLQTYSFSVSSLSPIHIGTGLHIEPGEYLLDGDVMYQFEIATLAEAFDPVMRNELLTILNGSHSPGMLLAVQRFFQKHQQTLLPFAQSAIPVSGEFATFYRSRIGQVQQQSRGETGRRGSSGNVFNKLQIQRHIQHPQQFRPYLPGSTLKGAIRTAVLDQLNRGERLRAAKAKEVEQKLLQYRRVDEDPFKALKVADAMDSYTLPKWEIFDAVNKKRKANGKQSSAGEKGVYQSLECIGPMHYRRFQTEIRIQDYSHGVAPLKSLGGVISACNLFYSKLLLQELNLLEKLGLAQHYPFDFQLNWVHAIKKQLQGALGQKLLQNKAMLLRVGYHGGAESNTIEGMREIKIRTPKGMPDRWSSAPTTLWLAATHKAATNTLLPFGWILLELDGSEEEREEPALKSLFDAFSRDREKQHQSATCQLQQYRHQWQLQQKIRREEAQKQAEAERLHKQRESELAAMSEVARATALLSQQLSEQQRFKQSDPGGQTRELGSQLTTVINMAAEQGTAEEKSMLRLLALDLCRYWAVDHKKNKKMKEKLKVLL